MTFRSCCWWKVKLVDKALCYGWWTPTSLHAHSPAPLVVQSTCVHHLYGSSLGGSATNSASGFPHVSRALQNWFARSSLFQFEKMAGFQPHLMRSILLKSNSGLTKDVPGVSSAIGDDAAYCCAKFLSAHVHKQAVFAGHCTYQTKRRQDQQ